MNISTALCRDQLVNSDRDVFAHWAWAIPVLLIVAALGVRQIDLYPPGPDEFYSMYNAGFLAHGPYTPFDVIDIAVQQQPKSYAGLLSFVEPVGKSDVITISQSAGY